MKVFKGDVKNRSDKNEHPGLKIGMLACLLVSLLTYTNCSREKISRPNYHFNGKISEQVLRNYLDRSITLTELCTPPLIKSDASDQAHSDNLRLIKNIGAKLVGRSLFCWGGEEKLNDPEFLSFARETIEAAHAFDKDIVFQAAIFEAVSKGVERINIPYKVFEAFGLPVSDRAFNYQAMLFSSGLYKDRWGEDCSVPDVTKMESKLWLYFLASTYIDSGFEGIHWGQVALMGHDDPDLEHWSQLLGMIRSYARAKARRHFIINDAHAPHGGFLKDGKHLFDFNSFPLRIKALEDEEPNGILAEGYLDAIYNKSRGGRTPSGWACKNLPYLVEFDNFGISSDPGNPVEGCFIWGYDEISWFSLRREEDQKAWLEYAYHWLGKTDPNGYLQMPVSRVVTYEKPGYHRYNANIKSSACPNGTGLEIKIKELWTP
jgi:hypothetical protein